VSKTVAQSLAERIAALDPAELPAGARTMAQNLVLDVVGLCVAARRSDYVRAVAASGLAPGRATAIGHARTVDAAGSALINGTAAHGEDFDDTFEGGPVHAGAVVVPTVLAVAEEFGADGRLSPHQHLRHHGRRGAGFMGPVSVFEGTHGLFHGFAPGSSGDYGQLVDGFGADWVSETLAFKPFACGTMVQPYVDCAIRLARRGIAADAIDEIVCEVAEGTVHRLWEPLASKQAPPNPYAAKFSTPFCIAAGFILGDAGLAVFTEATVADPRLRSLAQKIRYVVNPANPYPRAYTGHLRARLKTGKVVEDRQPHLRGGAQEPLSLAEIEQKFYANAAFGAWPREKAKAARALVARLFEGSVDLAPLRD
jgi:2-methylcitrate dehydratase PrpD